MHHKPHNTLQKFIFNLNLRRLIIVLNLFWGTLFLSISISRFAEIVTRWSKPPNILRRKFDHWTISSETVLYVYGEGPNLSQEDLSQQWHQQLFSWEGARPSPNLGSLSDPLVRNWKHKQIRTFHYKRNKQIRIFHYKRIHLFATENTNR